MTSPKNVHTGYYCYKNTNTGEILEWVYVISNQFDNDKQMYLLEWASWDLSLGSRWSTPCSSYYEISTDFYSNAVSAGSEFPINRCPEDTWFLPRLVWRTFGRNRCLVTCTGPEMLPDDEKYIYR